MFIAETSRNDEPMASEQQEETVVNVADSMSKKEDPTTRERQEDDKVEDESANEDQEENLKEDEKAVEIEEDTSQETEHNEEDQLESEGTLLLFTISYSIIFKQDAL